MQMQFRIITNRKWKHITSKMIVHTRQPLLAHFTAIAVNYGIQLFSQFILFNININILPQYNYNMIIDVDIKHMNSQTYFFC